MNAFWANIVAAWEGAERGRRITLVVLAVVIVAVTAALCVWTLSSNYQVLFAELDARDAAAIVEELKRAKVPYQIADGGSKILVEDKVVHETRLRLMGRGVPISGGVGFEIFDGKDVGMTEYTQKINYQRALQGELARTIMAINQVKLARVHLVIAEGSIFKRQKLKPKASVSLILKPDGGLSNEQILGIQRLVAAAVPGLDAASVTVLDQRGVTLSATAEGNEDYAAVTGKFKLKKSAEEYFVRKISEVLDKTFGPGQAIVSVDVTLDFDEIRRTQESIIPVRGGLTDEVGAVVRKRQSVNRPARGPITKATVNGEPQYAAASGEANSTTEVEYEVGKSIEQVVTSPGGIRRVSVGVIVPKMTDDQLVRMHAMVGMIVGLNEARGDALAIQSIDQLLVAPADAAGAAAAPAAEAKAPPPAVAPPTVSQLWPWSARPATDPAVVGAIALAALLLGMLLTYAVGRRGRRSESLNEVERQARLAEIKAWLAAEKSDERGGAR